ncbi:UTP--glucose-1-phosphate uridylyltransferase [Corynebacterium atypicum]|uniref:UTP--glucose-1-phosphate uridylyltransferase n=1 Tax=Corynebacterium atypicum TaxID=191610 RepID=A0ABM5QM97_9CORY|nr:DUF4921 family protein [Corynebacterium atypicum]AIG63922.1 UTP--glucose-1-phosphate uridylyltransferase [Corynebacterium atypicum]
MNSPYIPRHNPLTVMADGTIKQVNPFTGTQVWTVPGRGNRPLSQPASNPVSLDESQRHRACAFCSDRMLDTPPEKSRMVRDDGHWRILRGLVPEQLGETTAEFRRVPNLFEIVSYDYWRENYDYKMDDAQLAHRECYEASDVGREHVLKTVRTKLKAAGANPDLPEAELLELGDVFFGGGHDLILGRRHFVDDATNTSQLASAGTLSVDEHAAFIRFTVDSMAQLYEHNRYARYVAVFQNWLKPAGASFDHLHKQLVALDERGVQTELEVAHLRENFNMYNEWAVDYASYHNLIIAENQHAVCFAGFGHRYPTIEVFSKSAVAEPWLQDESEIKAMSDLLHACHAATGPDVPSNEEWHHKPVDLDVPMPWRVMIKWRVSTLAGFEGGTKIYVNTLSPENIRDRVTKAMFKLRDEGKIAQDITIGPECELTPNPLRYNPLLP